MPERRNTLRIAILIERFGPGLGGVENVAWQVARGLARSESRSAGDAFGAGRAGDEITVFAREVLVDQEVRPAGSSEQNPTLRIEHLAVSAFWQPWRVAAFDRAAYQATYPKQKPAFDIVHSFSRTRHQDLYRAGGGSHADYLRHSHSPSGRAVRAISPRHRIQLAHERHVFRDPDQRIQCSSRLVADALIERECVAPERIWILPNAVDVSHYGSDRARAEGQAMRATESRSSRGDGPLWLFPGSGWRRKGLEEVFRALASPAARRHQIWVAGRDAPKPWQERARALGIRDRVRFLGAPADLAAYYHAVDGVLLPTRYDPFANITLEAAAAGRPIVTSRTNGAAEWLAPDLCVVDDPSDPAALAAALQGFESGTRRADCGARLARRARAFDWPEHIAALREEYARIHGQRAVRAARQATGNTRRTSPPSAAPDRRPT